MSGTDAGAKISTASVMAQPVTTRLLAISCSRTAVVRGAVVTPTGEDFLSLSQFMWVAVLVEVTAWCSQPATLWPFRNFGAKSFRAPSWSTLASLA